MIVGSEITLDAMARTPLKLVLLVETREGYTTLCRLITQGRRRSAKGEYRLTREDFADGLPGLLVLWIPDARMSFEDGAWLKPRFDGRLWLAVELHRGADDAQRLHGLLSLAEALGIPAVASGDVHMHVRGRRSLQDTMTAIRHRTTIAHAGRRLFPTANATCARDARCRRSIHGTCSTKPCASPIAAGFRWTRRWATSIRTNSYRTAIRRRRGCASWSKTACASAGRKAKARTRASSSKKN
jgi:DNA polymerase III alpha subunit